MDSTLFAQWESFAKSAVESSKELEAINVKLLEQLVQKHMELVSSAVDSSNKLFAMLSDAKAYPEILSEQAKLASAYGEKIIAATKQASALLAASREDYRVWFEKSLKVATAQAQSATEAATPKLSPRKAA